MCTRKNRLFPAPWVLSTVLLLACSRTNQPGLSPSALAGTASGSADVSVIVEPVTILAKMSEKYEDWRDSDQIRDACENSALPSFGQMQSMLQTEIASRFHVIAEAKKPGKTPADALVLETAVVELSCGGHISTVQYALPLMLLARKKTQASLVLRLHSRLVHPATGRVAAAVETGGTYPLEARIIHVYPAIEFITRGENSVEQAFRAAAAEAAAALQRSMHGN